MECFFLGEAIRKRRLELGLTQEQLCEGICEPITISRLENGKQTPSRNRINAILERLDLPLDRYFAFLSKREMEVEALRNEIISYNIRFEKALPENRQQIRRQALELHKKLEKIVEKEDTLSWQQILRSRVIFGKEDGPYTSQEKIQLLQDAIHLTSPKFDIENIQQGIYTEEEVKLINQLGVSHSVCGNGQEALSIFSQLYRYMIGRMEINGVPKKHTAMVAFNYARELDIAGHYQEAVEVALAGQQICISNGNYYALTGILSVLAECYFFLGERKMSKDYYCQTYYLSKAVGDDLCREDIREEARNYLGLEFDP